MNLAEALLASDSGRITKLDTKEFEIPRLTKLIGGTVYPASEGNPSQKGKGNPGCLYKD